MNNNAPLMAILANSILGGSALALLALSLDFGPVLCAVAYSVGGSVTLLISAVSVALPEEAKA